MRVLFYLIELRKHLDRSEDKLKSARILLENNQTTDSIGEAYYSIISDHHGHSHP